MDPSFRVVLQVWVSFLHVGCGFFVKSVPTFAVLCCCLFNRPFLCFCVLFVLVFVYRKLKIVGGFFRLDLFVNLEPGIFWI